jgi:hypothetical protein
MFYIAVQKYYNNGKVIAYVEEAKEAPDKLYEQTDQCDIYRDTFDTREQAEEFATEARKV